MWINSNTGCKKMNPELQPQLQATPIIDFDHEAVQTYTTEHAGSSSNQTDQAISLYYAVRDGIRYNPYKFDLTVNGLKASTTIEVGEAWCVPKAALLAAYCRAKGIPARLGYADVRNHLSTARMREQMQTDIFHWHGYTSLFLEEKWVKATPAFNIELCDKFRFRPLEFDGQNDSIYHPFDLEGNKHMDYILLRGEYDDVPLQEMQDTFSKEFKDTSFSDSAADFNRDVEKENDTEG
jgi:transglutaminase-like putative cysteine protease